MKNDDDDKKVDWLMDIDWGGMVFVIVILYVLWNFGKLGTDMLLTGLPIAGMGLWAVFKIIEAIFTDWSE